MSIQDETAMHHQFAAQRRNLEWFEMIGELKVFIDDMLSQLDGRGTALTWRNPEWDDNSYVQVALTPREAAILDRFRQASPPGDKPSDAELIRRAIRHMAESVEWSD